MGTTRVKSSEILRGLDLEWLTETSPTFSSKREVTDGLGIRNLVVSTKFTAAFPEVEKARRYLDASYTMAFTHVHRAQPRLNASHGSPPFRR